MAEGSPQALSSCTAFSLCRWEARDLGIGETGDWVLGSSCRSLAEILPCLGNLPGGPDSQDPRAMWKGQFEGMGPLAWRGQGERLSLWLGGYSLGVFAPGPSLGS